MVNSCLDYKFTKYFCPFFQHTSLYALLEKVDGIDQDIITWKQQELLSQEVYRFGYNITSNKLTSLIEVLDETSSDLTVYN
ncbi:hypothetical protein PKHYL_20040 [Psychrobacter sp. KH172YL61]|nr:hypothetical protein PKHYL_20040 [Psychrobacter sp. KH172YL61]